MVFCDSSFWHGRYWKKLSRKLPEGYWRDHINATRKRDRRVNACLRKNNFKVLRFWDNDIENNIDWCVTEIKIQLRNQDSMLP